MNRIKIYIGILSDITLFLSKLHFIAGGPTVEYLSQSLSLLLLFIFIAKRRRKSKIIFPQKIQLPLALINILVAFNSFIKMTAWNIISFEFIMILIILNFNEKKNESEIFNFQTFITNLFLFKQLFKLLHVLNCI